MTMNPKARITYRFDRSKEGNHAPMPVRKTVQDTTATQQTDGKVVRLYPEELQFAEDVMPWRSPFQDDPYALEKLIRDTDALQDERRRPPGFGDDREMTERQAEAPAMQAVMSGSASAAGANAQLGTNPEAGFAPEITQAALPVMEAIPAGEVPLGLPEETGGEQRRDPIQAAPVSAALAPPVLLPVRPARPAEETHDPFDRAEEMYGDRVIDRQPNDRQPNDRQPEDWQAEESRAPAAVSYTGYIAPRRRSSGPSWLKVFASVAGAVLTGALFGYLVLSLFADQPSVPAASDPSGQAGAASGGSTGAAGGPAADGSGSSNRPAAGDGAVPLNGEPSAEAAAVAVDIPARGYYLLQFGVFSSEEGLEAALVQLKEAGYSAAADRTDGYRAFAGITDNAADAELLAEQLEGTELFVKRVELPAAGSLVYGGQAAEAEAFFARTDALVRFMSERSTAMLAASNPEPFGEKTWGEWEELHKRWTESAAAVRKGAPEGGVFEQVSGAVGTAADAFEAYRDNPSRSHLWTAQSALMNALFAQKEWLGGF